MRWAVTIGVPLLYAAAVVWGLMPPSPTYVSDDPTSVTVTESGKPELLHSPAAVYPEAALRQGIEGKVTLRVTVDDDGRVAKVSRAAGPELLASAAMDAVKRWQFTPAAAETEIEIPFLRWHPGPRHIDEAEAVKRAPAFAGRGRHGMVRVVATVSAEGRVESATAVGGPRKLLTAGENNVRQWIFRPELHDGKPVRGTAVVTVEF